MRYVILMMFFTLCSLLFATGSNINEDTVHFIGQASAFTIGSELVTDGGFPTLDNWTEGTWTLGSGVVSENNAGGDSDILSDVAITTVTGRVYRVQFEVTAYTDGAVTAVFDGVEIGDKSQVLIYTSYVAATDTSSTIALRADATFTGSCDNVSVVAWVGDLDAGGGTTIAGFTGTLTDYMSATGGVLHNDSGLSMADQGGSLEIAAATTWDQTPIVGTLVKCDFSATFTDGIYEITTATDNAIVIDLSSGGLGAETAEVWIGGAYPDIATARNASTLAEDPDGTYRKRYICVNVDQEVDTITDFVAETSETALREDDGSRKIIGFYDSLSVVQPDAGYRIVSDMDQGGIYYGGAWEAFKRDESFTSIRSDGKWVEWNAKGNDINILELNTSNFEMRNIKIHNTIADSTAEGILHIDTANFNTQFVNCWFATSSRFVVDDLVGKGNGVLDCYFEDTIDVMNITDFRSSYFIGCIINLGTKANGFAVLDDCYVCSCLIYEGQLGINQMANSSIMNNIFFNQTASCVTLVNGVQAPSIYSNNIFSPAEAADIAIDILFGSLGSGFNNIMYSVSAGAVLTNPIVHDLISPNPPLPVGTLEVDPLFVNPADGDFRLRASSPALNGGLTGLFDGRTTIGAWGPNAITEQERRARHAGTPIYR